MKKIRCVECGKELILLGKYVRYNQIKYEFWCDDCNTEILVIKEQDNG